MRLVLFIADLARDPRLQEEFTRDPQQAMTRYELQPAEQAIVLKQDRQALATAVAEELHRELPELGAALAERAPPGDVGP
jgi:hypothetical protein